MKRREFIALFGGAAAAWPLAARGQHTAMPVVALIGGGSPDASAPDAIAFRKGLNETSSIEGLTIEYHWLEGQYDRLPALMADLVRRQVAVIATGSVPAALAAQAATATIPIVFGVAEDPVRLGLVTNLARPSGNATGINWFVQEVAAKRLRLLHDLVPKAVRFAVLINPANVSASRSQVRAMSIRMVRTRRFGACSAICRHSAACSLHSTDVIIAVPRTKTRAILTRTRCFVRSISRDASHFGAHSGVRATKFRLFQPG
jgi:putative ABC transport system substrate-binding protein